MCITYKKIALAVSKSLQEEMLLYLTFFFVLSFSVKHEYEGKWSENTRLSTCDPHAKRLVTSSNSPLEVEAKQEVIFTYDVEFQVISLLKYFSRIRG